MSARGTSCVFRATFRALLPALLPAAQFEPRKLSRTGEGTCPSPWERARRWGQRVFRRPISPQSRRRRSPRHRPPARPALRLEGGGQRRTRAAPACQTFRQPRPGPPAGEAPPPPRDWPGRGGLGEPVAGGAVGQVMAPPPGCRPAPRGAAPQDAGPRGGCGGRGARRGKASGAPRQPRRPWRGEGGAAPAEMPGCSTSDAPV